MARWIAILLMALLGLSLAVNVYLWTALNSTSNSDVFGDGLLLSNKARSSSASSASVSSPVGNAEAQHASSSEFSNNRRSANTVETTENGGNTPSLEALLEKRQFDRLALELSNALKQTPFDERLLLLEADMIRLTKPLSIALVHLYDLAELPLSVDALEEIGKKIATLYEQAQEQLSRDQQWELLAKLNEPLFQRVPDSRQYALNLARAYAHQRKQTLMEDALAPLPFDDAQAQAIRAIAYKETDANDDTFGDTEFNDMQGDTTDTRTTRVALMRVGDQYRLDAKALNQKAVMILDTGASTTAISSRLYARLGRTRRLTFIGNFNVRTASGTIEAPLVKIPRFYFAGYEFTDVSAIVLPEEALPDTDGLLGMNVLGEFDFSILPQSNELRLKKRS